MTKRIKCTKKEVAAIVEAAYPQYRGRKFTVQVATSYSLANFWDGGTRDYVVAYDLATGKVANAVPETGNPFHSAAHAEVEIPEGVVLVEHSFFQGKDCGITIHARPENMPRVLPELALSAELAGGSAS